MAKLTTGIHEAISSQLRLMYNGIIDEGAPDWLAAILSALDGDPTVLPIDSAAA